MTKDKKKEIVAELTQLLDGASGVYSIDFTGLSVAQAIRLRRQFKEAGVRYKVAKNTLMKRALQDAGGYEHVIDRFVGQSGVAVGYDDPASPARVLNDFIDPKTEIPKLNFALIEREIHEGDKLKQIAAMPTRKEILAAIVGSIAAPSTGIVGAINAVMRDIITLVERVAEKQQNA